MNLSRIFFILLGFSLLAAGCGDGGKARYDLEPISAETAVEMLERAGDDPVKTDAVIERVRTNRTGNFDFRAFWARLSVSQSARRLSPEQRSRLLALHEQSCKDTDFDSFAQFILSLGSDYEYIVGEFRKCQNALGHERTRAFPLPLPSQRASQT